MALRISLKRFDLSELLSTHKVTKTTAANADKITSAAGQPHTVTPAPATAVVTTPPAFFTATTVAPP